ncbi:MAG: hypothetical protein NW214_16435 [Pseudanabaenaceae cyanobacterium bins.39]|nr:hypothetical protein [Pseudanabaenaceae cyanobacterium bins.39]
MSREVIQDFLNLTGVVGIALTNRRMRPYFYGLDAILDRTKQALGQGVLQVIENIPEGFESFEFHFSGNIVYIYKLAHGLVLLILTDQYLEAISYKRGIAKIKYLIETDTYNTVAYFKLLLGSVTQHSLPSNSWNAKDDAITIAAQKPAPQAQANQVRPTTPPSKSTSAATTTPNNVSNPTTNPKQVNQSQTHKISTPPTQPTATSTNAHKSVSTKTATPNYKLDELVKSINQISTFTTQYLGKVVVTNYWKSTRPDSSWLAEFDIDRNAQISHPKQAGLTCNPEQHQQIKKWVANYVQRCKQVIRNFDQMLGQDCLDDKQRESLL